MAKDIWGDEPFHDGAPEFTNGQWKEPETYTPAPENMIAQRPRPNLTVSPKEIEEMGQEDLDDLTNQVAEEDDEEDFSDVLTDARLRLELGRLYEMVMNHSLFDGVEVDERASKIVQKQIRKFAKEQIELTLGMRQESTAPTQTFVSSPFNDLEVQVLKKLASAASKGATETEEANQVVESAPAQPAKKKTLNTIGKNDHKTRPVVQPKAQPKPIVKKAEPIQRAPKSQAHPERPPKELTGKMLHEMNAEEKAEYLEGVNERNKSRQQVIPQNRAPWPSYEQQVMIAESQVSRAVGTPTKGNLSALIMSNLKNSGKI